MRGEQMSIGLSLAENLGKGRTLTHQLLTLCHSDKFDYMCKWEKDIDKTLILEWRKAVNWSVSHSRCTNQIETAKKLQIRWYWPPSKLVRLYPKRPNLCWWRCRMMGNLLHVWWSCPCITHFWMEVSNIILNLL